MAYVIGYENAKNLMKQLDWKLRVTMDGEELVKVEVYHPKRPTVYTVRKNSFKRLYKECRVVGSAPNDARTAILCYDHDGSNEELI